MEFNISTLNGMNISGILDEYSSDHVSDLFNTSIGSDGGIVDVGGTDDYDYSAYYDYDDNGTLIGHANVSTDTDYAGILGTHYVYTIYPFEVRVLGALHPFLILLTAITNALVIRVFLSRRRRGKASNLLFVSIAISDTLTGVVLLPNDFYIYASNRLLLTEDMCTFAMIMRFYVSRVFHTASVWQTVLLGVQRFLCVCHPFMSSRICTFWKTVCVIVVLYICAMALHAFHLTNEKIWVRQCIWHIEEPCQESCVYMWVCTGLQHLLPVFVLIYLTARTILSLKKAARRVSVSSRTSAIQRHSRDRLISITATLIAIVFLVPELPHGIFKFILLVLIHSGTQQLDVRANHIAFAIYEIFLVISFHLNFWIYCIMMRDFRNRIIALLTFGYFKKRQERERHMSTGSSSSRQGTIKSTLSRTSSDAKSRLRIRSTTSSQQAMVKTLLSRSYSDGSARNRMLSGNTSLPSTTSDQNGSVTSPPPEGDFRKFMDTRNTTKGTDSYIPMITQTQVNGELRVPSVKCSTQISQESAYLSGDANEDDVFL